MNIDITKKEYLLLLDMLCIADWILEAFSEDGFNHPEHQALKTKLFALHKKLGAERYIEYDNMLNDYFETQSYEQQIQTRFIEPYEETVFWDELIHRLAMRDLINEVGNETFTNMDLIEKNKRINAFEQHYEQEFQKNGVANLVI